MIISLSATMQDCPNRVFLEWILVRLYLNEYWSTS